MFEIMKSLDKAGIQAKTMEYSFGHYYDGIDHDFSFPCAVVNLPRELSGIELHDALVKIEKIEKKHGYSTYDKRLMAGSWTLVIIRNDHIEEGRSGYGETVAFQYGFWMKHQENKDASDDELIAAGHAAMIEKGYAVRH